jgi:hypothetical protein
MALFLKSVMLSQITSGSLFLELLMGSKFGFYLLCS